MVNLVLTVLCFPFKKICHSSHFGYIITVLPPIPHPLAPSLLKIFQVSFMKHSSSKNVDFREKGRTNNNIVLNNVEATGK